MGVSIATFNVKNLLEPANSQAAAVLPGKIAWLASKLTACDADVVGLQEIGSGALLSRVLDAMHARGGYGAPVLGTVDARGIGCALLSRLPILSSWVQTSDALPLPVFREGDPPPFGARLPLRRGVVHARVDAGAARLIDVFVAHFKSARPVRARDASGIELGPSSARERAEGQLRSLIWRAGEGLFVRGRVDEVLAGDPDARIAVVGDLNDEPGSWAVRAVCSEGQGALLDACASIPAELRYSCLHGGRRIQIDHVLVTAGLHARIQAARIDNADLRQHEPLPEARPAAQAVQETPTIDSDHAPVIVQFG